MARRCITTIALLGIVCYASAQIDVKRADPIQLEFEAPEENSVAITWITPETGEITDGTTKVDIKIGINTESTITNIEIYINGQPAQKTRGFRKASADERFKEVVERQLSLNRGENEVKIIVENSDGTISSNTRTINIKSDALAAATAGRRDFALLFATDEYENWGDLVNPVNDAQTIAKELEENYGFNVEILTNVATDDIYLKLREYAEKSYLPQDQLFVFFAGHGQFDESFREGYVVGKNSLLNDPAKSSYISHSNLRTIINNIPCDHILLAMDVCFGGTFDPKIAGHRGGEDQYGAISADEFIARKLKYNTRQYMTSGGKEYVPDGRPGQHSPFARQFLAALRSFGGNDRIITLSELFGFVERVDPEPRRGEFGSNQPGSDFIFVAK